MVRGVSGAVLECRPNRLYAASKLFRVVIYKLLDSPAGLPLFLDGVLGPQLSSEDVLMFLFSLWLGH